MRQAHRSGSRIHGWLRSVGATLAVLVGAPSALYGTAEATRPKTKANQ